MAEQIKDGTGSGKLVKVDNTNRILTRTTQIDSGLEAARAGDFYFVASGLIVLTSANKSAVLYMQNDETKDLIMTRIIFGAGASTGGTTDFCVIAVTIAPTGLSSSNAAAGQTNSNLGSNKTLSLTSEVGQEAATVTAGVAGPSFFFQTQRTSAFDTFVIIPKGKSIAFAITPPASNSSLAVALAMNVHLDQEE